KPTVVWDHGYYAEFPEGVVCKVASWKRFTQVLEELCRSPERRRQVGCRAREYALRTFDTAKYCREFLAFVEQVLGQRPVLRVAGLVRRSSAENFRRIEHLRDRLELHQADLLDQTSLAAVLASVAPDEVYNLAAMSFVPTSWQQPVLTAEFTAVGVTRLLDALRQVCPKARFYQASSSEMFGKVRETPQRETTPFHPRSPYGVAKVYGH